MAIEIETSTDTVEEVKAALGGQDEPDTKADEKKAEKPAPKAKAAVVAEEEAEEAEASGEEAEPDDEEDESEAKSKPKLSKGVRERLRKMADQRNEERERRIEAERKLAEAGKQPPAAKSDTPQTYSGQPEPTIDTFTADSEKYPDPYAAYAKAIGKWEAAELYAKDKAERTQREAEEARQTAVQGFTERIAETLTRHDDYDEVVGESDVQVSQLMEEAIYDSEIGPDLLYYFAANPKEAKRFVGMTPRAQAVAMGRLEVKIEGEIAAAKAAAKDDEKSGEKSKDKPGEKPKTKSSAPPPPSRLKPSGDGVKTIQQVAGPEDKVGVDITFSRDYEKTRQEETRGRHGR